MPGFTGRRNSFGSHDEFAFQFVAGLSTSAEKPTARKALAVATKTESLNLNPQFSASLRLRVSARELCLGDSETWLRQIP